MRQNQLIWVGVIGLLIVGAIFGNRVVSGWLNGGIPDDKASATYFMCANCKYVQQLTDRDYDKQKKATMVAQQEAGKEGAPRAGRARMAQFVLQCPKCKQINFRPARKCPNDGEIFLDRTEDGSPNKCPKCGAVAGSPPKPAAGG